MSAKIVTVITGMALAAGITAANAGEPVKLTDAQMDGIVAGRDNYANFYKDFNENVNVHKRFDNNLYSQVYVFDPFAHGEAIADTYGRDDRYGPYGYYDDDPYTQATSYSYVDPYSSSSVAASTSALGENFYPFYYNNSSSQ